MFYFAKLCGRNSTYGVLSLVNRPVFTNIDMKHRIWLSKVYFQCESAYFRRKNFEIFISKQNFEINFECERGLRTIHETSYVKSLVYCSSYATCTLYYDQSNNESVSGLSFSN